MKAQIQDIKRALSAKAYLSAFALALTIPDACGLEMELLAGKSYSEVKSKSRKRYIAWYKKYLSDLNKSFLPAKQCYKLRCSYLHESKWKLKKINLCHMTTGAWITLHEYTQSGIVANGDKVTLKTEISLDIDIPQFCNVMCAAAEKFCADNADKTSFPFLQVINYE